jgi:hypothetical protein
MDSQGSDSDESANESILKKRVAFFFALCEGLWFGEGPHIRNMANGRTRPQQCFSRLPSLDEPGAYAFMRQLLGLSDEISKPEVETKFLDFFKTSASDLTAAKQIWECVSRFDFGTKFVAPFVSVNFKDIAQWLHPSYTILCRRMWSLLEAAEMDKYLWNSEFENDQDKELSKYLFSWITYSSSFQAAMPEVFSGICARHYYCASVPLCHPEPLTRELFEALGINPQLYASAWEELVHLRAQLCNLHHRLKDHPDPASDPPVLSLSGMLQHVEEKYLELRAKDFSDKRAYGEYLDQHSKHQNAGQDHLKDPRKLVRELPIPKDQKNAQPLRDSEEEFRRLQSIGEATKDYLTQLSARESLTPERFQTIPSVKNSLKFIAEFEKASKNMQGWRAAGTKLPDMVKEAADAFANQEAISAKLSLNLKARDQIEEEYIAYRTSAETKFFKMRKDLIDLCCDKIKEQNPFPSPARSQVAIVSQLFGDNRLKLDDLLD